MKAVLSPSETPESADQTSREKGVRYIYFDLKMVSEDEVVPAAAEESGKNPPPEEEKPTAAEESPSVEFKSKSMPKARGAVVPRRARHVFDVSTLSESLDESVATDQSASGAAALDAAAQSGIQQQEQQTTNSNVPHHRRTISEPAQAANRIFSEMQETMRQYQQQMQQQQAIYQMQASMLVHSPMLLLPTNTAEAAALIQSQQQAMMFNALSMYPPAMPALPTFPRSTSSSHHPHHQRSMSDGVTSMRCFNCDGFGHISKECPMVCSFCRMPGHWSGNCAYAPLRNDDSASSSPTGGLSMSPGPTRGKPLRCFNCGLVGHRSVHCLMPCQYCNRVGHWSGLCPYRTATPEDPLPES